MMRNDDHDDDLDFDPDRDDDLADFKALSSSSARSPLAKKKHLSQSSSPASTSSFNVSSTSTPTALQKNDKAKSPRRTLSPRRRRPAPAAAQNFEYDDDADANSAAVPAAKRGRTKAQRLRAAQQQEQCQHDDYGISSLLPPPPAQQPPPPPPPLRKVHFAGATIPTTEPNVLSSQDTTLTSSSSSSHPHSRHNNSSHYHQNCTAASSSPISVASSSSFKSKAGRTRRSPKMMVAAGTKKRKLTGARAAKTSSAARWFRDDDHDDSPFQTSTTKAAIFAGRPPRPPMATSTSLLITGAGRRNVYDAGQSLLMRDECQFVLSTLHDQMSGTTLSRSLLTSLLELGLLLSKCEQRALLVMGGGIGGASNDWYDGPPPPTTTTTSSTLQSLLDLLGEKVAVLLPTDDETTTEDDHVLRRDFAMIWSMILHFLSLDCTLTQTLSSAVAPKHAATRAMTLRKRILSHESAVQGILHLMRSNALLRQQQRQPQLRQQAPGDDAPVRSQHGSPQAVAASDGQEPGSPASVASQGSNDPTALGRRKRKLKMILASSSTTNDEYSFCSSRTPPRQTTSGAAGSVASSIDSPASHSSLHFKDKLDRLSLAVYRSYVADDRLTAHTGCTEMEEESSAVALLPLLSLTRIIHGKCPGDEHSCLEIEDKSERNDDDDDDDADHNPLLWTNQTLQHNGSLPLLAAVLVDVTMALDNQLTMARGTKNGRSGCAGCVAFLHICFHELTALIDGACLFHEDNRVTLCQGHHDNGGDVQPLLIPTVVAFLQHLQQTKLLFDADSAALWGETTLEALKVLTSLTHENAAAAADLRRTRTSDGGSTRGTRYLDVIVDILYEAATTQQDTKASSSADKLRYDAVIFCLNMVTNLVDSHGMNWHDDLRQLSAGGMDRKDDFWQWLTVWIVDQTDTFQDALRGSTFGSSPSRHAARKLTKQEDEHLVTAGNGVVLVSCLLATFRGDAAAGLPGALILPHLPGDGIPAKVAFCQNTLKAFCNFYHYSVGDLSVAVVEPVKKLIGQLDSLDENDDEAMSVTSSVVDSD